MDEPGTAKLDRSRPPGPCFPISLPRITYSVDSNDRIVGVNQEWTSFALANDGDRVLPENVLGQDLWPQISDATVRGIYRLIMSRARRGHVVRFRYRCDSPGFRRTFEMTVQPGAGETLEFDSALISEVARDPVNLFADQQPRDSRMVRVCSWCQRVATEDGKWVEVEEAVRAMGYLENTTLPQMSHGICPECAARAFGEFGESEDAPG